MTTELIEALAHTHDLVALWELPSRTLRFARARSAACALLEADAPAPLDQALPALVAHLPEALAEPRTARVELEGYGPLELVLLPVDHPEGPRGLLLADLQDTPPHHHLAALLEASSEGVLIFSARQELVLHNQRALELLGRQLPPEDPGCLLPASTLDAQGQPIEPEHTPVAQALLSGGDVEDAIIGLPELGPDGGTRWLHVRVSFVPELGQAICLLRDASEAVHTRAELRHERSLLGQTMRLSPIGVTIAAPSGELLFANPAAERLLGVPRDQITSRRYDAEAWEAETPEGEPWPQERHPFEQIMRSRGPVYDIHQSITSPGDGRRVLSISGAPILDGDQITSVVFTLQDITAHHERERQHQRVLEHMEELTRLESLEVLAGGIAHDFNNLLGAILGSAELLLGCPRTRPARSASRPPSASSTRSTCARPSPCSPRSRRGPTLCSRSSMTARASTPSS